MMAFYFSMCVLSLGLVPFVDFFVKLIFFSVKVFISFVSWFSSVTFSVLLMM